MRRVCLVGLLLYLFGQAVPAVADPPDLPSDVVRTWNQEALATVRAKSASDAQAARAYAMVNVAMYDAVNGAVSHGVPRRGAALVPPARGTFGSPVVAAAQAAHDVLAGLYPDRSAVYDALLATDLAGVSFGQRLGAVEWGSAVAAAVLAARANDGSSPNQSQPGVNAVGQFRASWSGVQFRNLAPFAIGNPDIYVSAGPPALTSLDYAAAFNEVKLVGNAAIPDAAKLATFQFWSLGGGTSQPPGAWLQVALGMTASQSLGLEGATRLLALTTMAMADTVAPTYTIKFDVHSWRPATAIQEADLDGNPFTEKDATWAPRAGGIGTSPEHWSGHSSFSASASTVLQRFFCSDGLPISVTTDSAPGGTPRTYASFSAAEAEAGRSRVVGGIHFEFSNQAGLVAGRGVAAEVVATKLLPVRGATHHGQCPL